LSEKHEKRALEINEDVRGHKKQRIVESNEIVIGYHNEGLSTDHFKTLRNNLVDGIINLQVGSILFSSPPFTGKTSLSLLIYQKLADRQIPRRLVNFNLYLPWKFKIEEFWKQETGFDYKDMENLTDNFFFIIDEFQKTYPSDSETVKKAYLDDVNPSATARDHVEFHSLFKTLKQNVKLRFICFSSYGNPQRVQGSLFSPPYNFEEVKTDHQHFSMVEYEDLCHDFINRTRIQFIHRQNFPESLKQEIWNMTNGHVGYTSAILHHANMDSGALLNEVSFINT